MLGRMFGHEFHALVIFQKILIADGFAALFGFWPPRIELTACCSLSFLSVTSHNEKQVNQTSQTRLGRRAATRGHSSQRALLTI